jgi:mediator of RNA polymerase II transcription subunit 29
MTSRKQVESNTRFDKHLEEFFSICDQIELHLVTAKKCIQQANSSQMYLPVPVVPVRNESMQENALTYSQYLELVKTQISYAKDIHDTLLMAAQNI